MHSTTTRRRSHDDVLPCSGSCEYPGCSAPSKFEAWFRFPGGHLVRLHCCREHAKKSIAYEAMGEAAFQPAAGGD
jgi:hypothetical protein